MKKLLYTLLVVFALGSMFSACSDDYREISETEILDQESTDPDDDDKDLPPPCAPNCQSTGG